jgi:DNA polymerase (family 10)
MPIHNADIAARFEEIADRLAIQRAYPFRLRALRNALRRPGSTHHLIMKRISRLREP